MRPRQKSDEMISVGLKCFRANVDLPEPEMPISTTSDSSGIVRFVFAIRNFTSLSIYPQAVSKASHQLR